MNRHYLNVFLRNLIKGDTVTYINITGLAVGLTCAMLIMLWIKNELTYDRFHKNIDEICRMQVSDFREGILTESYPITSVPMAPALAENFPEIKSFTRLQEMNGVILQNGEGHFTVDKVMAVDSSFFDIFSFELIYGDTESALTGPNKIILTETEAKRVFKEELALGKSLLVNGTDHFLVSGVVKDPPQNSHLKFNGLMSIATLWQERPCMEWDCNISFYSYLLLNEDVDIRSLESKFPDFLWEPLNKKNAQFGWREDISLIPMRDIHFHATSGYEIETPGNLAMVYLFLAIAVLILVVAGINFVNLSTAQASKKGKEIGIKKVIGATRRQLALQNLGEVFIQAFIALTLAIIALELLLPVFNSFLQIKLAVNYQSLDFYISVMALLILITIGAGVYSAFYFSGFNPVVILKNRLSASSRHSGLRNSLIVIQFTVSIALIAGTFVIYDQLHFLTSRDLGLDKENVLNIPLSNEEAMNRWTALKDEINDLSEVVSVGASTFLPGGGTTGNGYIPEGFESPMMIKVIDIDEDFLKTMGIQLADGRSFSKEFPSDKTAFIINETLAKELNWDEPVGKFIDRNGVRHEVIGVARDFNFASLHNKLEPLILTHQPWEGGGGFGFLSVKLKTDDFKKSIGRMESIWQSQIASLPFEFSFLEDRLNALYQNEERVGKAFLYFSILAIFISCMGLFGVVLFLTEQKTKEIGIRKALGGSVLHILLLLSKDLTKWIVISLLISIPIAWISMDKWLMNFAYAVKLNWWIFAGAGIITILLAWSTISWHTVKAALKKPVDTLRYE